MIEAEEQPIVISEDDARGADSPQEGTTSDTLVPMLVWGLGLALLGMIAAFVFLV
jgi:hypothetical protein